VPSFGASDRTSGDASALLFFSLEACTYFGNQRLSFNLTLFITGVFAVSAGASPDSITLCSLAAVWSIGVGGNLPVDSAVFLGLSPSSPIWTLDSRNSFPEFIPASHQYLLTVLSIWWALGQLLGSLVGLFLLPSFPLPHLRLGCVAINRQLFLPDNLSPFSMSALREPRLALLPLRNGWPHARPLRASLLCLPPL
jgi:hypothetical protein